MTLGRAKGILKFAALVVLPAVALSVVACSGDTIEPTGTVTPPSGTGTNGAIAVWTSARSGYSSIAVSVSGVQVGTLTGFLTSFPSNCAPTMAGTNGVVMVPKPAGTYPVAATANTGATWSSTATVYAGVCTPVELSCPNQSCPGGGNAGGGTGGGGTGGGGGSGGTTGPSATPVTGNPDSSGNWGPWIPTGIGVSISFARVTLPGVTWKFRNDTTRTLAVANLDYTYIDASTNKQVTSHDVIPRLSPGATLGGWTAYLAPTRGSVIVLITSYSFQ